MMETKAAAGFNEDKWGGGGRRRGRSREAEGTFTGRRRGGGDVHGNFLILKKLLSYYSI